MAEIYRRDEPQKKKKKKKDTTGTPEGGYIKAFQGWLMKKIKENQRENQRKYQIPGADKHLGIERDKDGYIIEKKPKVVISTEKVVKKTPKLDYIKKIANKEKK